MKHSYQAALCALRVIKKVPDFADHYIAKAKSLLTDRNHGVLLAAITLVSEICQLNDDLLSEFRDVSFSLKSTFLSYFSKGRTHASKKPQIVCHNRL